MKPKRPGTRKTQIMRVETPCPESDPAIPTLSVTRGPRVGSIFRFKPETENTLSIGRTADSDIVISSPTLSRIHAIFTWTQVGSVYHLRVRDNDSTNGTFVNGERIQETFLRDGDRIDLGEIGMRFQNLRLAELAARDRLISKATEAEQDPLTGLANRRFLEDNVPVLLQDADSRSMDVSLLLLDLDHFKVVNDTFGHATGDEVLRITAKLLESLIRESDVAVRCGGEEFLVILPAADLVIAELVAERIRFSLQTFDASFINPKLKLTTSIGATIRRQGEDLAPFMDRADRALYQAKGSGRNRVIIFDSENRPVDTEVGEPGQEDYIETVSLNLDDAKVGFRLKCDLTRHTAARFERIFRRFARGQGANMALDLSLVQHLDSAGIGVLIQINRALGNQGGKLKLCNVKPDLTLILQKSRIGQLLRLEQLPAPTEGGHPPERKLLDGNQKTLKLVTSDFDFINNLHKK